MFIVPIQHIYAKELLKQEHASHKFIFLFVLHQICITWIILVNIPVEGIRLLGAVCLLLGKRCHVPFAAVWSQPGVVCSEKVMFDPLTFSKKNPSRAIPRSTYIHPPSLAKIRQRTSEE